MRRLAVARFPLGRGHVAVRVAIPVALALLATACHGHKSAAHTSGSDGPSTPTTISSSASTSSAPSPAQIARAQAVAAYLGMWRDFVAAGRMSSWKSPRLSVHATGDALLQMSRGLYADHLNGLVTRGEPIDHPTVKSVEPATNPTTVLIFDCADSSRSVKYVAKTGKPAAGAPGGRQAITAEVKKRPDGAWKVDRFAVEGVGSCAG